MLAGQPINTRLQIVVQHNDKTFTLKLVHYKRTKGFEANRSVQSDVDNCSWYSSSHPWLRFRTL